MGLFRAGVEWTQRDLAALLREAAALANPPIDAYTLANQPYIWGGARNPLASLGARPSPSCAYSSALPDSFPVWRDAHFSKATQKKLRKKARRLELIGPLAHLRAGGADEARVVIDAFLPQKRARMRALGLPNEFDGEPTTALLTRLSGGDAPLLELHALRVGERIVATFAGFSDGVRLSGLFLSHDIDPAVAASSPGELLIVEVVRDAIERGLAAFDLGVGEARYKNECCETTEALFDSALAVLLRRPRGRGRVPGGAARKAARQAVAAAFSPRAPRPTLSSLADARLRARTEPALRADSAQRAHRLAGGTRPFIVRDR